MTHSILLHEVDVIIKPDLFNSMQREEEKSRSKQVYNFPNHHKKNPYTKIHKRKQLIINQSCKPIKTVTFGEAVLLLRELSIWGECQKLKQF